MMDDAAAAVGHCRAKYKISFLVLLVASAVAPHQKERREEMGLEQQRGSTRAADVMRAAVDLLHARTHSIYTVNRAELS